MNTSEISQGDIVTPRAREFGTFDEKMTDENEDNFMSISETFDWDER